MKSKTVEVTFVVPVTYTEDDFEAEIAEGMTFDEIMEGYRPIDFMEMALQELLDLGHKDDLYSVVSKVLVDDQELSEQTTS